MFLTDISQRGEHGVIILLCIQLIRPDLMVQR
jgi:hypothetical protein